VAEALHLLGRERAQLGLAVVAPGEDRGGVADAVRGRAMAGGLAAAALQLVDGAFEQFAYREEVLDQALLLVEQLAEESALAAGAFGSRRHGSLCMRCIIET